MNQAFAENLYNLQEKPKNLDRSLFRFDKNASEIQSVWASRIVQAKFRRREDRMKLIYMYNRNLI